ncbi:50S ribosomal protein L18 [Natronomonas gomsonensis]|jgi:large subunit ribosomal protein L18|uniref:50S ribosomal protein L18 n=1 Tax=Natronomonas gomsonensis TaxID=1046043 RepID=UPI0020CA4E05|nr:50S ribosomal protein L18 [Natronomonas gomsonensis]MCY4731193.1 50S ribosomal protein L18 [Natronomonas gomsonensis]
MATGPRYKVPMRRRREARTNYHQRLRLLKSGKPRLVARKSNNQTRAQLIVTGTNGDETLASASSADLEEFGWEAPTGNLPAAYLTGLLAGKRAVEAGLEEAVLDIGLNTATPGNKAFAVQEGAIDAGLEIPHNDEVFADWQRTRGTHIAEYAEQEDGLYSGDFDATELPDHFDEVRERLEDEL